MENIILDDHIELTEEEAREFFSKFDSEELEQFDFIFYFAMSHNLAKPKKILEEVKKEKNNCNSDSNSDITSKTSLLSLKELNYLYNLTDDGWMCTINTREYFDYSDEGEELNRIKQSIYKEIQQRLKINKNILNLQP